MSSNNSTKEKASSLSTTLSSTLSTTISSNISTMQSRDAQLFSASVMHKRLSPKVNAFTYRLFYLVLPIKRLQTCKVIPINRRGWLSFWEQDHGPRDHQTLQSWMWAQLRWAGMHALIDDVMLIAMPRVVGYSFNPVTFWLCLDKERQLRAVLCEVNNTFGETHRYFCRHEDHRPITATEWLSANKMFHVSPFFDRVGEYRFRFAMDAEKFSIHIHYYDAPNLNNVEPDKDQQPTLITALSGTLKRLSKRRLAYEMVRAPLVTMKTTFLIHWQAVKLLAKGCQFFKKPEPHSNQLTVTEQDNARVIS